MSSPISNLLFHYTASKGLDGILKSQSLWATHYQHLNDSSEIHYAKHYILDAAFPAVRMAIQEKSAGTPKLKEWVDLYPGGLDQFAKDETSKTINKMYTSWFEIIHGPFIVSFTTASGENVLRNGLLSQWRTYGQSGGYAIEFDKEALMNCLERENEAWKFYISTSIDKVHYSLPQEFQSDLDALVEYIKNMQWSHMGSSNSGTLSPENALRAFIKLMTFLKHPGFSEEREFRLTLQIPTPETTSHPAYSGNKPIKPIHHFERGGSLVPYLDVFGDRKQNNGQFKLPIRRILVGPHPEKRLRKNSLDMRLQGENIEVQISDIPFTG